MNEDQVLSIVREEIEAALRGLSSASEAIGTAQKLAVAIPAPAPPCAPACPAQPRPSGPEDSFAPPRGSAFSLGRKEEVLEKRTKVVFAELYHPRSTWLHPLTSTRPYAHKDLHVVQRSGIYEPTEKNPRRYLFAQLMPNDGKTILLKFTINSDTVQDEWNQMIATFVRACGLNKISDIDDLLNRECFLNRPSIPNRNYAGLASVGELLGVEQ